MKDSLPYYIYLAADHPRLALEEVRSLLHTGGYRNFQVIGERILRVDDSINPAWILERAALVKYAGRVLYMVDDIGQSTLSRIPWSDILEEGPYILAVDPAAVPGPEKAAQRIMEVIREKRPGASFHPAKAKKVLHIIRSMAGYWICESPTPPRRRWIERRPRARVFFHPTALHPRLARCLVNLTAARPGQSLLDPFCGTGSILIEAGLVGLTPLGIDLSPRMVHGALANLRQFRVEGADVILGDGTSPPIQRVDAIATDLPYGRASKTMGREPRAIAREFAERTLKILPPGGRCVVLHAKGLPVKHREARTVLTYELPVHRNLTRVITVLEMV